ncbi:PSP1 domain-containing protein [Trichococcus collinsii]|uniref:Intein N-terminal splicing region n=1 Tax=Trichococcus collinsii TaxID=157076 RepID=A0AB38A397_9LACT|nr:stage 0 sporulation family protein [Trichococcus collinsii]CZR00248.1 Hypothetical protein Tcol_1809 [Trichococcus collinsii]SEA88271.1 intein N-terminal splicing region [Trichococcus collinsii]HRF52803.1 stage 0 sporulation family protein [Trichococcus flocculiformis]
MKNVIGVRFMPVGPISYYEAGQTKYKMDEKLIINNGNAVDIGQVVIVDKKSNEEGGILSHKNIIRVATEKDLEQDEKNRAEAKEAFAVCKTKMKQLKLEMKLIKAEYTFDRSRLTFHFSSEGRIDFRELVRELAAVFRTRIELHQIGVRDEAKILGGIGPCGRTLCCSTFLGDFVPVSIKMAKDQGLSLNPTKISGLCGRLMCCLNYENDTYVSLRKAMPDYGQEVMTPEGKGKVVELNVLSQVVKVRLFEHNKTVEFASSEL